MAEYTSNPAPDNHTPDCEHWARLLDETARWLEAHDTPAARLTADLAREAAQDSRLHGIEGPDQHREWLAETDALALSWLEGAWDPADTWEASPDAHAHSGYPANDEPADLN